MHHKLDDFISAVTRLADGCAGGEAVMVERAAALMSVLVAHDDWLPAELAVHNPQHYQQHLVFADPQDRFSLVSFVWGPGQQTPIHDHTVWGIIGMLRGAECGQHYTFAPGGHFGPMGPDQRLEPGQVECVSPTLGDIHQVRNAFQDRVSVSLHLYGGNIGKIQRHVYAAETGARKEFVSGYCSTPASRRIAERGA